MTAAFVLLEVGNVREVGVRIGEVAEGAISTGRCQT